jgi:hypothetical protein
MGLELNELNVGMNGKFYIARKIVKHGLEWFQLVEIDKKHKATVIKERASLQILHDLYLAVYKGV